MGLIHADITIVNTFDMQLSHMNKLMEKEVRKITVKSLVDTVSVMLCINEEIMQQLGLQKTRELQTTLADGTKRLCDVVGPVTVQFLNRATITEAIVLPSDTMPLLGAIPMEGMDVIIDPLTQQLGLPPDRPYMAQVMLA